MIAAPVVFWLLGAIPLAIWLGLLLAHGRFWTADQRDDRGVPPEPAAWPPVVAVVPARGHCGGFALTVSRA